MAKTVRAVFDGEALRLEQAVGLRPNRTYVITIEEALTQEEPPEELYPLTEIARLATDMGVADQHEASLRVVGDQEQCALRWGRGHVRNLA